MGVPGFPRVKTTKNQLSLPPPIILVSYKHTRLAQNTFEREGVLEKTKPERGLQPTLSKDGVAVSVTKSEGVKTK